MPDKMSHLAKIDDDDPSSSEQTLDASMLCDAEEGENCLSPHTQVVNLHAVK